MQKWTWQRWRAAPDLFRWHSAYFSGREHGLVGLCIKTDLTLNSENSAGAGHCDCNPWPLGCGQFSSVTQSRPTLCHPWTAACQASQSITSSQSCSNSCPSSRWCPPTISSSVVPFSSCLQSCPTSGSFLMSQFFTSGGQSIGASASASVLLMNIQDWFSLGLIGLISLQSKGFSRVFSKTTVQKHQFLSAQLSL